MAAVSPTDCSVCQEIFDEESRCPRILPCSHYMCSTCIDQLIASKAKICPFCRKAFEAESAKNVMVNHGLLECVKYMSLHSAKPEKPLTKKSDAYQQRIVAFKEETAKANSKALKDLLALEKMGKDSVAAIRKLQNILRQESSDMQENILQEILNIVKRIDRNVESLELAATHLEVQLSEVEQQEKLLTLAKSQLDSASSFEEAAAVVDGAEETNMAVTEWTQNLRRSLDKEGSHFYTAKKETDASKRMKKDFIAALNANTVDLKEDSPSKTKMEEGRRQHQQQNLPRVTALDLWEMSATVLRLIKQGRIFGVNNMKANRPVVYRITIENSELHVYNGTVQEERDPNFYYIKIENVLELVSGRCPVFLDFSLKGSAVGRTRILLEESPINNNIPSIVIGSKGSGCVNKEMHIGDKGTLFEHLVCETNPRNNYSLRNLNPRRSESCGSVNYFYISSDSLSFGISIGPYASSNNVIGHVTRGLEELTHAIRLVDNATADDLKITSAGVILGTKNPIRESWLDDELVLSDSVE